MFKNILQYSRRRLKNKNTRIFINYFRIFINLVKKIQKVKIIFQNTNIGSRLFKTCSHIIKYIPQYSRIFKIYSRIIQVYFGIKNYSKCRKNIRQYYKKNQNVKKYSPIRIRKRLKNKHTGIFINYSIIFIYLVKKVFQKVKNDTLEY